MPETQDKRSRAFRFGPFLFHSEIDLQALGLAESTSGRAVRILRGPVDAASFPAQKVTPCVYAEPGRCLLDATGVGRFLVENGSLVTVDIAVGAEERDVRGYLTAWVFGALCHQNGLLPLHACAVERNGVAVAFLGDSGAGKSTLAAFLARRGATVVADDICLLEDAGRQMQVVPVASWMKLWRGSLEALGVPVDEAARTFTDEDKFRISVGAEAAAGLHLRRVVYLQRSNDLRLERASAAETIGSMMRTTYLGYVVDAMELGRRVFAQSGKVLAEAEGYVLHAPMGWDRMDEILDLVEAELFQP